MTTPKMALPKGIGKKNLILIGIVIALLVVSLTVGLTELWDTVLLKPILNFLVILSNVFFGNFGIAIIILVVIVRVLMMPVTLKQLRSTKAMSSLQPKLQEVQKKYGKDRAKLQQEMARVYRESGVSPMGCIWPLVIQLPIWIALYQSILKALAATPEEMLSLSKMLYSSSYIHGAVPLNESFLWLNLGLPDPFFIMAILVAASMWVLQKMSTLPTSDPKQQSMNNMLVWMMPLMFGFFTISFPSGLAVFWVVSNIIGIVTQYFITGWGSLSRKPLTIAPAITDTQGIVLPEGESPDDTDSSEGVNQERLADGESREKRKDRRRSHRAGTKRARRKSR